MRALPIAVRARTRIDTQIPQLSPLRRFFSPFSSLSSSSSSVNPRVSNSFFEQEEEEEGKSAVYKHKLKFQSPSSVLWKRKNMWSASFIGTVVQPLKISRHDYVSAYTFLSVGKSPNSKGGFRILVNMRGNMAEMCFQHLKENDYIYVSGCLRTKVKAGRDGILRLLYKVEVEELNYVTREQGVIPQDNKELQSDEGGITDSEKYRNRLHLWQIFFSSPYEWWDNRKDKIHPNSPDFKHKGTGETLWLSQNDPPWVEKQLQRLDSRMAERGEGGRRLRLSKWEYDE